MSAENQQHEVAGLKTKVALLESTVASWKQANDNQRATIQRLQDDNAALERRAEEGDKIVAHLGKARADRDNAQRATEIAPRDLDSERTKHNALIEAHSILNQSCEQWRSRYSSAYNKVVTLHAEAGGMKREIKSLRESNNSISNYNAELQDQNEKLRYQVKELSERANRAESYAEEPKAISNGYEVVGEPKVGPDELIRKCAMFARDNNVTVTFAIEGVTFTIVSKP